MKIIMEPQPVWEEEPVLLDNSSNEWVGRYRYLRQGGNGEAEVDVDVDIHLSPIPSAKPTEIDGKWYWVENEGAK